jgi:hypothetical protein
MAEPQLDLAGAWTEWCRFLGGLDLTGADPAALATVSARLERFSPAHRPTAEHVDAVVDALYRGVPLLLAALGWQEPRAGGTPEKATQTDALRGEQWRLVMAYGGFETAARALLAQPQRTSLGTQALVGLLARCELPAYRPLEPPAHSEAMVERWFGSAPAALLEFLGLDGEDSQAVSRWLADRQPAVSWAAALALAKALRNATASGALSASKVKEWKLRPALRRLVDTLAGATAAALARLNAAATAPAAEGEGRLAPPAGRKRGRKGTEQSSATPRQKEKT